MQMNTKTSELRLALAFFAGLLEAGVRFFRVRPYSLAFVALAFLTPCLGKVMDIAGELVHFGEVYAWLFWLGLITALLILSEVKEISPNL